MERMFSIDRVDGVKCAMCGSNKKDDLFQKEGIWVTRCKQCHLVYAILDHDDHDSQNRYTEDYFQEEYMPQFSGGFCLPNLQRLYYNKVNDIREYRRENKMLDVGCAVGSFMAVARADGWRPYGVEISEYAAKLGREELDLDVTAGTLLDMDLPEKDFDVITLWDVIEHLRDPRSNLEKAHELLRQGGIVAICTPNIASVTARIIREKWWIYSPPDHIYYFTFRTLKRMLHETGFEIARVYSMGIDWDNIERNISSDFGKRLAGMIGPKTTVFAESRLMGEALYVYARKT